MGGHFGQVVLYCHLEFFENLSYGKSRIDWDPLKRRRIETPLPIVLQACMPAMARPESTSRLQSAIVSLRKRLYYNTIMPLPGEHQKKKTVDRIRS